MLVCLWVQGILCCSVLAVGSSAGAGSGEFHVYRHLRRREYQRQDYMDAMAEKVSGPGGQAGTTGTSKLWESVVPVQGSGEQKQSA